MLQKLLLFYSAITLAIGIVRALPSPQIAGNTHAEHARDGVTTLSASALNALTPYTQFARAAYCDSSIVDGWQCGRTSFMCSFRRFCIDSQVADYTL